MGGVFCKGREGHRLHHRIGLIITTYKSPFQFTLNLIMKIETAITLIDFYSCFTVYTLSRKVVDILS